MGVNNLGIPPNQQPNILAHVVHHLRYKVYSGGKQPDAGFNRQPSSSSSTGGKLYQPSTSQEDLGVTDTERVHNSFACLLYRRPRSGRQVKYFLTTDWQELESEATECLRENRSQPFTITAPSTDRIRYVPDIAIGKMGGAR